MGRPIMQYLFDETDSPVFEIILIEIWGALPSMFPLQASNAPPSIHGTI